MERAGRVGVGINGKREKRAYQKCEENGEVCRSMDMAHQGLLIEGS